MNLLLPHSVCVVSINLLPEMVSENFILIAACYSVEEMGWNFKVIPTLLGISVTFEFLLI